MNLMLNFNKNYCVFFCVIDFRICVYVCAYVRACVHVYACVCIFILNHLKVMVQREAVDFHWCVLLKDMLSKLCLLDVVKRQSHLL